MTQILIGTKSDKADNDETAARLARFYITARLLEDERGEIHFAYHQKEAGYMEVYDPEDNRKIICAERSGPVTSAEYRNMAEYLRNISGKDWLYVCSLSDFGKTEDEVYDSYRNCMRKKVQVDFGDAKYLATAVFYGNGLASETNLQVIRPLIRSYFNTIQENQLSKQETVKLLNDLRIKKNRLLMHI